MCSKLRFLAAALGFGAALLVSARADEFDARYQAIVEAKGKASETERLHDLFHVDWAYLMDTDPEAATYDGYPGGETRWSDQSPAAIAERKRNAPRPLKVLATIDRSRLSTIDQVSYDLFQRQSEEDVEKTRFPSYGTRAGGDVYLITQMDGIQQDAAQAMLSMPASTPAELETQVTRLKALPAAVDQVIALLDAQMKQGITPPRITLRDVPAQVLAQIPDDPFKSPLLRGFADLAPTIPEEDGIRLRAEAAKVYAADLRPAFQRLETFLTEKYLAGARTTIAITDLPDGAAWYAWRIKTQTSTNLTAREIHELGLAEVKRIRAEMEKVKAETGFKGTMAEFFTFLRTDPRFFFTDKDELVRAYRDIAKRADPQLTKLFKTLPRTPYGVLPVPSYAEKSQTTAYYFPGAPDTNRPGYYYVNTYALNTRPKWEMEALTLHESVPGHHIQISLAQELGTLPEFRRFGGYTAFVEGWALYAEHLGEEMGFYTDPYSKFGQLTYEMWRAVRLVVDTGMHEFGWSREQAIQYFKDNAGKSEHDIEVEIDRYIVWPGQALAYKLGELKIKELRADATKELGSRFDVRQFHDEVLRNGAVPLSVLDAQIRGWVAAQKR